MSLRLDEYELQAARTINPRLDDRDRVLDAAAGLAEEAGEVLGHVRKHALQGRALDREAVVLELGDTLWCLAMTARALGISLDEVARCNLAKLHARFPEPPPAELS